MRPWDLDDCEVAIAELKDSLSSLRSYVDELEQRIFELEDEQ